jgi:hypothetical protein
MTANPPDPSSDVVKCEACGEPLGDAERFCTHCGAPLAAPSPVYRARVQRRKWRRRRRLLGTLAFLAVAAVLGYFLVSSLGGDDESPKQEVAAGGKDDENSTTTTTAPPPAGPYKVTDGVNLRAGPGSSFASLGQIEVGNEVQVVCVTDGEAVPGPSGETTKWLRVVTFGPAAYITAQYVATGPDIQSPTIIPPCAAG